MKTKALLRITFRRKFLWYKK